MTTARIAADFVEEYATLLELSGASPFRVRAYANAVRTLKTLPAPLDELLAAGTLTDVKGIGDSVAELVAEFADTGTAQAYEKLRAATPEGLLDMLRVPNLGRARSTPSAKPSALKPSMRSNKPAAPANSPPSRALAPRPKQAFSRESSTSAPTRGTAELIPRTKALKACSPPCAPTPSNSPLPDRCAERGRRSNSSTS